jgi:hypothetical protein
LDLLLCVLLNWPEYPSEDLNWEVSLYSDEQVRDPPSLLLHLFSRYKRTRPESSASPPHLPPPPISTSNEPHGKTLKSPLDEESKDLADDQSESRKKQRSSSTEEIGEGEGEKEDRKQQGEAQERL